MLDDLIIPADSLSTSLVIGLSIALKAGGKLLRTKLFVTVSVVFVHTISIVCYTKLLLGLHLVSRGSSYQKQKLKVKVLHWDSHLLEVAVVSRSSVVIVPAAEAGGPGFNPQQLPWVFSLPAGRWDEGSVVL